MSIFQKALLCVPNDRYAVIKSDINKSNKKNLLFFSVIASLFLLVLGFVVTLDNIYDSETWMYFLTVGLLVFNALIVGFATEKNTKIVTLGCCFFMVTMLFFGMLRGVQDSPSSSSTVFVVLLLAVPLILTIRPWLSDLIIVFMVVVFIIAELHVKDAAILFGDMINSIAFGLVSVFTSTFMTQTKYEKFLAEHDNEVLLEDIKRSSVVDALTGIGNRNAYEMNLHKYKVVPKGRDFVYVSIDLNGLKVANDTKGHAAGDELIKACAECMEQAFKGFGNLYRVGGDEFVAVLFVDKAQYDKLLSDFEKILDDWHGDINDEISVAIGSASISDYPECNVSELSKIADKQMYANKGLHYKSKGVDRRGRQEAHTVLCSLYTKILKINLGDDSYQMINVDMEEQTPEKGFSENISDWFKNFAGTGQVHPEDQEEFLKKTDFDYIKSYFADGKTSLHIFYRRKIRGEYKQVMMEMIPVDTFSEFNQELFLYVKDIEK